MKAFGVLARFRFLRGTALDPFGQTGERKTERALITQYRETVESLLPQLTAENLQTAVAIASLPEQIRGFGHVKERHLKAAEEKRAELLQTFHQGAPATDPSRHAA